MTTNEVRKTELKNNINLALKFAQHTNRSNQLVGRELSIVITKLEEAMMWAEKIKPSTVGD